MRIRAVIFDLGDTLISSNVTDWVDFLESAIGRAYERLLALTPDTPDSQRFRSAAIASIHARAYEPQSVSFEQRLVEALSACGVKLNEPDLTQLVDAFFQPLPGLLTVAPGAISALGALSRRGYRLAVISNSPWGSSSRVWREVMDRSELTGFFDVIAISSEVGWRKPGRQIFDWTLRQLDLEPEDCVFVGDSPTVDIAGARSVGMRAILKYIPGRTYNEELTDIAVVHSLLDLPLLLDGCGQSNI